ncbi:actin-like protein 6A [Schistocerca gregaria]|uniref:actin-like protein 6A n=1 Tax=Schistocerca gregaria TaxID=7010 RepID=UPI00211EA7E8|nr:actin-like protein 6A [Schistocerca gregaria]
MEVSEDSYSVVIDVGHHTVRIGCSQDDSPRMELPSQVGILDHLSSTEAGKASCSYVTQPKKYLFGNDINIPRGGMESASFFKDGMIDDWDSFEKMLEFAYDTCFNSRSEHHPILISEPAWNVRRKREQLTELMFEKFKVPAFFLVKNAALTTFANRRTTALVIDSGATHTSAVPVQDGFVLSRGIVRTPLAGDFLTTQCGELLKGFAVEVVPPYMVASKEAVAKNEKSKWVKHPNLPAVTTSWHKFMIKRVLQDFQSKVLEVSRSQLHEEIYACIPPATYEFPDGYCQDFHEERMQIPEALFNPEMFQLSPSLGIGYVVKKSVSRCEADVRAALYSNVVIAGGNSLLKGFPERLCTELAHRTPSSMRLKVIHGGRSRRISSWIGGSIVASLGTFQQMWISAQEYEDAGKNVVEKKCP